MKNKIALSTLCACIDENENIWFVSNEFNALFCWEHIKERISYITTFDEEDIFLPFSYSGAIWYQNKIFLFPLQARKIAVYIPETQEKYYIEFEWAKSMLNILHINENLILLFPNRYSKEIYFFDLEKEEYKVVNVDYGNKEHFMQNAIIQGKAFYKDKAYYAIENDTLFFSFDIYSHKIKFYNTYANKKIFNITADEKAIYVLAVDGKSYDEYIDGAYIKTHILEENLGAIKKMEYVINEAIPSYGIISIPTNNKSIKWNNNGMWIDMLIDWRKVQLTVLEGQAFAICIYKNQKLYVLPYESESLLILDCDLKKIEYKNMKYDVGIYGKLFDIASMKREVIFCERARPYLSEFTKFLLENKFNKDVSKRNSVGKKIYCDKYHN